MNKAKLHHQTQPTPTACVQTCLAMIMNVPVREVLNHYPNAMGQYELISAMLECGIIFNSISLGPLIFEGFYTACVPSLNKPGANHQIILDLSFDHDDGNLLHVLDPNNGREGVHIYAKNASNLYSWTNLIRFQIGGRLP